MKDRGAVGTIGGPVAVVNERLLSVKEAAHQLGMSPSWLYQSDVPYIRLKRRKLFSPADLARYIDAHRSHRITETA